MPDDRFIHKRLGHSEKVNLLTDLEFRVWVQYLLSADDFGVMRFSAITVQADNDHLSNRKTKEIDRALQAVLNRGLVRLFEHQGRRYIYQPDWHDYQRIGYPRGTVNPLPPDDAIAECSPKTRAYFQKHRLKVSPIVAEDSRNISEKFGKDFTPPRARETAMANGKRLTANGERRLEPEAVPEPSPEEERAARLLERYAVLFQEHRRGAVYRARPHLDFPEAIELVKLWSDDRLDRLAVLVLTTDDPWISKTDRAFKIFATKATWADDRLRQWEQQQEIA